MMSAAYDLGVDTLFDQAFGLQRAWTDYLCKLNSTEEAMAYYQSIGLVDMLDLPEVSQLLNQQQDLGQCKELVEQTQQFIQCFQKWFVC